MCVFIKADAIMAVALSHMKNANEGLSYRDLSNYGNDIKNALIVEDKTEILFMDLMSRSFDDCVNENPNAFSKFMGKYYPVPGLNEKQFTVGMKPNVHKVMNSAAQSRFQA